MNRKERLLIKSRINKDCCKHYSGTNLYTIGYLHNIKCCKVAICKDCGEAQCVSGWFGSMLLSILAPLCTGAIYVLEDILVL